MSRAEVSKQYARILSLWPKDRLRPEVNLQRIFQKRVEAGPSVQKQQENTAQALPPVKVVAADPAVEMRQIESLTLLLENRFSKKYPVSPALMRPTSIPNHYSDVEKEIEELPDRTWWGSVMKRITGMVRMR